MTSIMLVLLIRNLEELRYSPESLAVIYTRVAYAGRKSHILL